MVGLSKQRGPFRDRVRIKSPILPGSCRVYVGVTGLKPMTMNTALKILKDGVLPKRDQQQFTVCWRTRGL